MNEEEIRKLLEDGLGDVEIEMQIDGDKLALVLSGEVFEGVARVKRQQTVYALLNEKIGSGEIHAVSMKCIAPSEK